MYIRGCRWRHRRGVWDRLGVDSKDTRVTTLASCWCLYCRVWVWLDSCSDVSVVDFGQVNFGFVLVILMTRFLSDNDISDCCIFFVVIFCSIRLLFTVNIADFNNYSICIIKLQVFMVIWSVLKPSLVLGSRFVATSQFICPEGWIIGFCIIRGFWLVRIFKQILVLYVLF